MTAPQEASQDSLNWTAVAALYAGLSLGFAAMLYAGQYRNAAWLALIGMGGGLTAYGRMLEQRGQVSRAQRWKWAAGGMYAVFFVWAGVVLIQVWMR